LSQDNERETTRYTFALALIIISAYIIFFGVVMWQNLSPQYDGLKTITATFGIIVAAVVGYYFGQRPAEAAEQRAKEATGQAAQLKAQSDMLRDQASRLNVALIDQKLRHSNLIRSEINKEQERKEMDSRLLNSINRMSQNG
jgi:uncharacterized membrane protein YgaE (UPF0421/DUF939 family)